MRRVGNNHDDTPNDSNTIPKEHAADATTPPQPLTPTTRARRKGASSSASAKRKRVRVAKGIYRDRYGLATTVKVNGIQREARFPLGTPLKIIRERREEMRASLRTLPKGKKHTLAHDAGRYIEKMVGRIVSWKDRRRHVMRWVEHFGHLRTLVLEQHIPQLNDQLHEWRRSLSGATCNLRRDAIMNLVRVLYGGRAAAGLSDLVVFPKAAPKPRSVDRSHIEAVLAQLPPGSTLLRLQLMLWTGMRPAQIGRLRRENFFFQEPWSYVVSPAAKGGNTASIPLVGDGLAAAKQFVELDVFGPWDPRKANRMLTKAATRAGRERFTTYQFRHTFATDLRRTGADVADIQYLYGHTSSDTTTIYAPPYLEKHARAIERMVPADRERGGGTTE